MESVGCIRCEEFQNDFMARTSALIAPVLQRVSCSNETLPNEPKHYETHQNICLGSNGVDRFRSLRKIPMRLRGTNFRLVAPIQPVLYRASCSKKTIENASKHYETHQNMSLGPMGWIGCVRCKKFWRDFVTRPFALIALVQPVLQLASRNNETVWNAPKTMRHTKTWV